MIINRYISSIIHDAALGLFNRGFLTVNDLRTIEKDCILSSVVHYPSMLLLKHGIITVEELMKIEDKTENKTMLKFKVNIRTSFGDISEDAKLVDGKEYFFVPSGYICGGPVHGEVMMVPNDMNYPNGGPKELALGDLEYIYE